MPVRLLGSLRGRQGKIAYGLGNLGTALLWSAFGVCTIFFYSDIVRLDPWLVGSGFAIYAIWNAANDPLIGYLSDRTRTRWGRRIPYVMFGTLPLLLFFILVWTPPVGGAPLKESFNISVFLYFLAVISLYDLFYTIVSVAYISLFPEMFREVEERAEVQVYRQVSAAVGAMVGVASPLVLAHVFSEKFGTFEGWMFMGVLLGLIGCIPYAISLLGSREEKEKIAEKGVSFLAALKYTLSNISFLTCLAALLMIDYIWALLPAMLPFYTKYVLAIGEEQASLLLSLYFITAIPFLLFWNKVCTRYGSKKTIMAAIILFAVSLQPLLLANIATTLATMAVIGLANSGLMLTREILISDVIDEDEVRTGYRREGMYFGLSAFFMRFSLVLVGWTTAVVLGVTGYVPGVFPQPEPVVRGLRMATTIVPLTALMVALVALKFYPLNARRVAEIREPLKRLHNEEESARTE